MRRKLIWILWLLSTLAMVAYLGNMMQSKKADRSMFLPGVTTAGHYQIELACNACHTPGGGVQQDACVKCHEADLDHGADSHPASKFAPLDKAELVVKLDARVCTTCHEEHSADRTNIMGVSLPMDYCFNCHSDIAKTVPSHAGFKFNTCATSGCHNFHDNRGLNETFLTHHLNEPDDLAVMAVALRTPMKALSTSWKLKPLTSTDADAPASDKSDAKYTRDWVASAHARAGVNCMDCHADPKDSSRAWIAKPDHEACARCHEHEDTGFLRGRHGMRLAEHMTPMTPAMARLPMKPNAAHRELTCAACHDPHREDTRYAATGACETCHNDPHTQAYDASPHAKLWQAELAGKAPAGSGVSCATCHMPRVIDRTGGKTVTRVQHDQNDNLRPNSKMLRNVCLHCHGAQFSLDALADVSLIKSNFAGRPSGHVKSLDMIRDKLAKKAKKLKKVRESSS